MATINKEKGANTKKGSKSYATQASKAPDADGTILGQDPPIIIKPGGGFAPGGLTVTVQNISTGTKDCTLGKPKLVGIDNVYDHNHTDFVLKHVTLQHLASGDETQVGPVDPADWPKYVIKLFYSK